MRQPAVLTVTQLNTYIKSCFDCDENLNSVFLSGEISNFTDHYRSGHLYFSLKDEKCSVKAVMFAQSARRLRFAPQDGMNVIVRGRVSVYEVSGQYQFYVDDMQPDGLGALNLAYEQLKRKLAAEGLFDTERKRPIPKFPNRIGVVTSPTGAAVHDICQILARRYPLAEVVLCPVLVQGEGAAEQIADAVARFNRIPGVDVLIVGRGGGSMEDLWAFNEEIVARAVAESKIPVISAVGHETDFTICDFAADLRAPTPSAAAELATPDSAELLGAVRAQRAWLRQAVEQKISALRSGLEALSLHRAFRRPLEQIEAQRMRLDSLSDSLCRGADQSISRTNARLSALAGKLEALSPLGVLARGYSLAYRGGKILAEAQDAKAGDQIGLRLKDGWLDCTVDQKRLDGEKGCAE